MEVLIVEIFAKAKDLADALANCAELAALKEAEMKMMMDSEARGIVEEYQMIQQEAMAKGLSFEDLSEEEKQRVEALEAAMNENVNISTFLGANQTFEQILRSVNMIITAGITGQQGGGCQQKQQGQQLRLDQRPVFHNAHGRGYEQHRQNGSEKSADFADLADFYQAGTKRCEQQHQTVNRCGDGDGQQTLKGFAGEGEAHDDEKLG